MDLYRDDQWLAFLVPLDDLGLTAEQARNSSFRVVTQILTTRTGSPDVLRGPVCPPPHNGHISFRHVPLTEAPFRPGRAQLTRQIPWLRVFVEGVVVFGSFATIRRHTRAFHPPE